MDLCRVLLLLLCMAAYEVRDVQTRPIDFVCDYQTRRGLNKVEEIKAAMGECHGSSLLPSSIQLPCVGINMETWGKTSLQEKRGQVWAALKALAEGLQRVRAQSQHGCQSTVLEQLEHSVTNYLHIVMHLEDMGKGEGLDLACQGRHTQHLDQVLKQYNLLLVGKLEYFVLELTDRCQGKADL
ncbi:hypothetical protein AAFF_G00186350 [Aldrovandia affinis]|uniref:Thrombopoietin n=1 Tax=Aldrovandia affinis TaxID=143900 RepID=A0AAD7SXU2_9TELE|nr:hypothetical protein AAFF_G00186350 [Aldrovandia affinis]